VDVNLQTSEKSYVGKDPFGTAFDLAEKRGFNNITTPLGMSEDESGTWLGP